MSHAKLLLIVSLGVSSLALGSQPFELKVAHEQQDKKAALEPKAPAPAPFLAVASAAQSNAQVPYNFRVMTTNVCNPVEVQRNPELFKKFSWTTRKERIFKQILDEKPDLIGFQEIRDEAGGSSVGDLWAGLGKHGYDFVSFRNGPNALAFINTIGYKVNKFALTDTNHWYASETPDQYSDSWGNGWGRVVLMATVRPIVAKMVKNQAIPSPDYDTLPIHFVNLHNGLTHVEKMNSNRVHVQEIEKLMSNKEGMVIVVGDFNTFPQEGGAEEVQVWTDAGYKETLCNLKTAEGIPVSGTFSGFSYDKFKSPKGTIGGGQLDHVFVKVFSKKHDFKSDCHVNLKRYNGNPEIQAKSEAELLIGPDGEDLRDTLCSDHVPGIVDLQVFTKPDNAAPVAKK